MMQQECPEGNSNCSAPAQATTSSAGVHLTTNSVTAVDFMEVIVLQMGIRHVPETEVEFMSYMLATCTAIDPMMIYDLPEPCPPPLLYRISHLAT